MTLRELASKHPEWLDNTLVVEADGNYDYVGAAASIYEADELKDVPGKGCEPTGKKLLVFAAN